MMAGSAWSSAAASPCEPSRGAGRSLLITGDEVQLEVWRSVGDGLRTATVADRTFSSQTDPPPPPSPRHRSPPPSPPRTPRPLVPAASGGASVAPGAVTLWAARSPALRARLAQGLALIAPPPPPPPGDRRRVQRAAAIPDPCVEHGWPPLSKPGRLLSWARAP
jgi:hypothetical protein